MPRVAIKRKEYKMLDLKGWVCHQMKLHGMKQSDVGNALGVTQAQVSYMLRMPRKGARASVDPFSYGDLLTLCELFEVSDEEKQRLLTL